ncbi:ABC transporter substrate-binding protein/permease [Flexivirga aerilata]|uniref:ABC transporter substrate-binding protein/permease n=1 Tax=Flexivirga aerilata TaxID=1656889 RepID=UPI0031B57292
MHNVRLLAARVVLAVVAVLLALAGPAGVARAAAPEPAHAAPAAAVPKVLRVGTEGVYPPFSYHAANGSLTGYDVELIQQIGKRLGVQVQFVQTPFDSIFAALESGRIDLVANEISPTPERQAKYDLSAPYISTTGVVVVGAGNKDIRSLADIKGKRAGQSLTSNWSQVAKKAGATIVPIQDMDKAMTALAQNRVQVVVNDELAVRNYLNTTGNKQVKIVSTTDDKTDSVFAARKGSGYMPQINAQIAAMRNDGALQQLYDKYFGSKAQQQEKQAGSRSSWQIVRDNLWPMLLATLRTTIPLTAISFVLGLAIALLIALMRRSTIAIVSWLARAYISIIRGTPLLVQLFIVFYGLPQLGLKFSPFGAAILALSLNVGGYAAEVIRSAIAAVPQGQWEAAETIGMDYRTTLRRVVLPQAARIAVPPLGNTLVSLVKDTSLTSVILVADLFQKAQNAAAPTFEYMGLYTAAAAYYWVICFVLNALQGRLEKRLNRYVVR